MNSTPETSPESLTKTPSSISSSEANSSYQKIAFLEAPLRALCQKPKDEMTPEEMREEIARLRRMRDSATKFRSELEDEAGIKGKVKTSLTDDWE